MAVATDYVRGEKYTVGANDTLDIGKQGFQFFNVVQGLIGDHGIISRGGLPEIEIDGGRGDLVANAGLGCKEVPTLQHDIVHVETVNNKILVTALHQDQRQSYFSIAVARTDADETRRTSCCKGGIYLCFQMQAIERIGIAETERRIGRA